MKNLKQNKGFTLIEIILAMAILGIILVAFMGAFSGGFINIITMGNKSKAVAEAQAVIDFMYTEGIDEAVLTSTFDIEGEISYSALETSPYNPAKPIYYGVESETIGTTPPDIVTAQKVKVLVYYQNGKQFVTLTALIP
jgi:prepilin-type N-terminal cleavage/methylation domain-containing protein